MLTTFREGKESFCYQNDIAGYAPAIIARPHPGLACRIHCTGKKENNDLLNSAPRRTEQGKSVGIWLCCLPWRLHWLHANCNKLLFHAHRLGYTEVRRRKRSFCNRLQCVSEPCPDQERCVVCVRVWLHACVCKRVWVCVCVSICVFVFVVCLFSWMLLWVCQGRGRVTSSPHYPSAFVGIFCGN